MKGKGYVIPENPTPTDLACLLLYVPNDPVYIQAMAGGFADYGRWFQWERDGTNRGSLAAAAWKEAIDFTFAEGWDKCMAIQDQLNDILDQLKELNDMNINVCCGGCSGGCGCKNGSGGVNDDGTPINAPLPNPPSDLPPESFVGQWQCDAANEMVDQWLDFYSNLFNLANLGTVTIAAVISIAAVATILTGGMAAIAMLVASLVLAPGGVVADWVRDFFAENRDDLICVMVNSVSPSNAYQNMVNYLVANKADQNGSFAGEWVENIVKPIYQDTDWNLLFTPDSMTIRLANIDSACNCQQIQELPEFDGWYLVPAIKGASQGELRATYNIVDYIWSWDAIAGAGQTASNYPDFPEFLMPDKTWIGGGTSVGGTADHAGYVLQKISGNENVRTYSGGGATIIGVEAIDWAANDVWTEWHTGGALPKLDFQAALEEIFAGKTIVHASDQTFTNNNQHQMVMQGLDEDPKSVQFRLFAVIAGSALDL